MGVRGYIKRDREMVPIIGPSVVGDYLPLTGGTITGGLAVTGNLTVTGDITGGRVYNAVYNDYAEFFPKGEETEAGDIIMLDLSSDKEQYVKAIFSENIKLAGIHSDEFAYLIGGETVEDGEDYVAHNMKNYIPCGLSGRCNVKLIGEAIKGAYVIPSDIPGVGVCTKDKSMKEYAVGYLVETDDIKDNTVRRLKVKLA